MDCWKFHFPNPTSIFLHDSCIYLFTDLKGKQSIIVKQCSYLLIGLTYRKPLQVYFLPPLVEVIDEGSLESHNIWRIIIWTLHHMLEVTQSRQTHRAGYILIPTKELSDVTTHTHTVNGWSCFVRVATPLALELKPECNTCEKQLCFNLVPWSVHKCVSWSKIL